MTQLKQRLLRLSAVACLLAAPSSFVAAQAGTIEQTGPNSNTEITHEVSSKVDVDNDTTAEITNNNPQSASSGSVTVSTNTTASDATSGNTMQKSELTVEGEVDNTSSSMAALQNNVSLGGDLTGGSIKNTGPGSDATIETEISSEVDVDNSVDLTITNNNSQCASSGSVDATNNTTVGKVTSGDVKNESTTKVSFVVKN